MQTIDITLFLIALLFLVMITVGRLSPRMPRPDYPLGPTKADEHITPFEA